MLTKSDLLRHLQCPKYLWLCKHRKDLVPDRKDLGAERLKQEGLKLEPYAYQLFPGGLNALPEGDGGFRAPIDLTQKLLRQGAKILFQPTFATRDLYCRSDIIKYDGRRRVWDICEVKGANNLDNKPEYLPDLAFQKFVLEAAGLPVGRLMVIHPNKEYVRCGAVDPKKLFVTDDLTSEVAAWDSRMAGESEKALGLLALPAMPEVRILNQCSNPHPCPFIEQCWRDIPEDSIYDLGLADADLAALLDRGVLLARDVPGDLVGKRKALYFQTLAGGGPIQDLAAIRQRLGQLRYPLYFLDYETFSSVVPPFDGYRPWQQIPFQYSLHVQDAPGAGLRHSEFLAGDWRDPVPELAAALASQIGPEGSVVAWYGDRFEAARNSEMGERCPEHREFFRQL
ncbi:MAG: DUF2779 domain-containing protein, partial [Patescibacteria group bacterium]